MIRYSFYKNNRHAYLESILPEFGKKLLERKGMVYDGKHPDIVFVFGGDGTLLHAVKDLYTKKAPFMLINDGTLGYYKEYDLKELDKLLSAFDFENLTLERHHFIRLQDQYGHSSLACNEFLCASSIKTLDFVVYVNSSYFMEVHGSGICLSSSFGSTGYNHSLGGTVFTDDSSLELTLIAPIRNKVYHPLVHSLVTSKGDRIGIEVLNDIDYDLAGDMVDIPAMVGKKFTIDVAPETFRIAHVKPFSTYQRMRKGFIED